jgi:tRNA (guanine37-N1)-methyltransferase
MKVVVVTLFPEMFEAITEYGVSGRAVANGLLSLHCINPREFTHDRHQTVDDRPYGGGPGMVMMVEPLKKAVQAAQDWLFERAAAKPKVIYLSPQGRKLDQAGVMELGHCPSIILVAGRYEGVDERFIRSVVDEEWSVGDYVLSGGELPAMIVIDALTRLLPGALGDEMSAEQDSFSTGLLDYPHFTRPPVVDGERVPAVLLSGDHKKISRWRLQQSLGRTWERRPDLLEKLRLDDIQFTLLQEFLADRAVNDVNFD